MYLLEFIEINVPDSFCGHHDPVVAIPIDGKTTYADIFEDLLDFWCVDHIQDLNTDRYKEAVWMFKGAMWKELEGKLNQLIDADIPSINVDEDDVYQGYYIYFALTTVEENF